MLQRLRGWRQPAPLRPNSALSGRRRADYGAAASSGGAEVPKRDGISKEDLERAVQMGQRIGRAALVTLPGRGVVPCIRLHGTTRWAVLRLRRYEASRTYRSLDGACAFLRACGYHGDFAVLAEGSPLLRRLPGITDL